MITRIFAVTATLTAGAFWGANAADMPMKAVRAPSAVAAYDWTGFYAGVNVGYGAALDSVTQSFTPATDGGYQFATAPQGWFAGGQLGFNWQRGPLLLGLEADAQGGHASQSQCHDFCGVITFATSQTQTWYATVRGRLGWAYGPVLLYGTGGAAFTTFKTTLNEINGNTVTGAFTDTRTGWTAGAGVEASLAGPWSAKLEYLYMDFGTVTHAIPHAFLGPAFPVQFSIGLREHVVRAALNYRFGAPAAAKAEATDAFASAASVPDWAGFYLGGNLGYAVQRSPYEESSTFLGVFNQFTFIPGSIAGGAQLGGTLQFDRIAVGIEADYQAMRQDQSQCGDFCLPQQNRNISESSRWFATARGRVGIVSGPAWYYVTGGAAFTNIKTDYVALDPIAYVQGNFSDARTGWTVGGGIEAMMWRNWSVKAEYLYMDFGTVTHTMPYINGFGPGEESFSISVRDHVFRLGLNYHFGGHGATSD